MCPTFVALAADSSIGQTSVRRRLERLWICHLKADAMQSCTYAVAST